MDTETDTELIRKTLAGDRTAAGRLVERHRRPILALAYQTLHNADDAQDVAQEALVYAMQRLPNLRQEGQFVPWLRHITLSLCADYRRRRGTRPLGEPLTALNERSETQNHADRVTVHRAVSHLSEAQRTTLLLHYVGGWSRGEVAGILRVPLNTVRSRLMAAKCRLRLDLDAFFPQGNPMPVKTFSLSPAQTTLVYRAFPEARIVSAQADPEPWMPFLARVTLALTDGTEKTVDVRSDIDADRAALLPALHRLGIPGPRLLSPPVAQGGGEFLSLCETPVGDNLLLWALGGTPSRIRLATDRSFEAIARLEALTEDLRADPVGARLPRRALSDELATLTSDAAWRADPWLARGGEAARDWCSDPWFAAALTKVQAVVPDITAPLVYTDYLHYFPNWVRVRPGGDLDDGLVGWPGDARLQENPLTEYVSPWGHFGDALLGLAMVWIYDCYPFVHTGFVEQFLWRRNLTRRDFAPRLALRALQTVQRELPVARPLQGADYWDALHGYVDAALSWL